jgi:hypothetical protein
MTLLVTGTLRLVLLSEILEFLSCLGSVNSVPVPIIYRRSWPYFLAAAHPRHLLRRCAIGTNRARLVSSPMTQP